MKQQLYMVSKKFLDKYKCRIGNKPYFYEVDDFESVDLNNKKDFEYLEYLIKNDFLKGNNLVKKQRILKFFKK